MSRIVAFVRLARPLFLFGGIAGVALGAAVAAWWRAPVRVADYLWAQALVTAFQLMVHFANDYFDRHGDVHDTRTAWSGGSGVLTGGALRPHVALTAALVCAALGIAAATRFALTGNVAVAVAALLVLVLAWSYSAPPLRLAARGLGEIDTALVVAVLVPSIGYAAQTGAVDGRILQAVFAPAAAMFAMMLCVELPDAGADLTAGKRTLVVRWGPARTWTVIAAAALVAASVTVADALKLRGASGIFAIPAAVSAFALIRSTRRDPRPATIAFWGVALYAAVAAGLAAAYWLAAQGR